MKLSSLMMSPKEALKMEAADTAREKELVLFGELAEGGVERLASMATSKVFMSQYQWLMDNTRTGGIKGQIRVRRIDDGQNPSKFILTTKAYTGPGDAQESNADCDEFMFHHFVAMAPSGQIKDRYSLPVEGHPELTWEVDVILMKDGSTCPWTKIDLEIPENYALPQMPVFPEGVFSRMIDKPRSQRTEEEEAILNDLFDNKFYILNDTVPETIKITDVQERFAILQDRVLEHIKVLKASNIEDPALELLAASLSKYALTSNKLRTLPEDKISRRALAAILRPYIEPLTSYMGLLSYDEAYFGEPEGELKSQLKELEYAFNRLLPPVKETQSENCDCEEKA